MAQRISDGAGRGEWTLTGATISDIEDIASATIGGTAYLYLADFGDNANGRSTINIFRVVEPTITGSNDSTSNFEQIVCEYPAGSVPSHKDAETLMVDPDTGDLYIVTKRITPVRCYAGTADTYIWSLSTEQGNARGTETTFVADYNSGTDERYSLVKFDLASIPSNATIVGCDLYLYIDVEGQFFELRKMYQTWDESSTFTSLGGLPAFDDVDAASVADARHGNYDTITGAVQIKIPVGTVQNWVDGSAANEGWVVYGTTNADGLQFRSRQHATAAHRPKLAVRYTVPRKALQLSVASNQYLTRAHDAAWDLSAASGFTACGWIYRDTNGLAYFAGKYAGIGTREWILYSGSSSFLTARLCADGTSPTVFNSILSISATGQWRFIALRHDPAQVGAEFIVNVDGSNDATAHAGGLFSGTASLRLGASDHSLADSHDGRMDAWGFWSRALSDAELDTIRNGGRGLEFRHLAAAQRNGLIAFYDLGEASGVRADYSGNGQHLTPVGGPTNADGLVT